MVGVGEGGVDPPLAVQPQPLIPEEVAGGLLVYADDGEEGRRGDERRRAPAQGGAVADEDGYEGGETDQEGETEGLGAGGLRVAGVEGGEGVEGEQEEGGDSEG